MLCHAFTSDRKKGNRFDHPGLFMVKANGRLHLRGHTLRHTRARGHPHQAFPRRARTGREDSPRPWEERVGAPRQFQDVGNRVIEEGKKHVSNWLPSEKPPSHPVVHEGKEPQPLSPRGGRRNQVSSSKNEPGKGVSACNSRDLCIGESLPSTPLFFPSSPPAPSRRQARLKLPQYTLFPPARGRG